MRIGRVSSRDAERATRLIVSTNAAAGTVDDGVAARLGQRREVLGAQRADVERRRAGDDLDVLLGGAQLERGVGRRAASGRRRAAAGPGGRPCPRARPSPASGTRRPTSMSVARSSAPSAPATSWTPESAWTALRVEATRETTLSCASRSAEDVSNFTMSTSDVWLEVIGPVQCVQKGEGARRMRGRGARPGANEWGESVKSRGRSSRRRRGGARGRGRRPVPRGRRRCARRLAGRRT